MSPSLWVLVGDQVHVVVLDLSDPLAPLVHRSPTIWLRLHVLTCETSGQSIRTMK